MISLFSRRSFGVGCFRYEQCFQLRALLWSRGGKFYPSGQTFLHRLLASDTRQQNKKPIEAEGIRIRKMPTVFFRILGREEKLTPP